MDKEIQRKIEESGELLVRAFQDYDPYAVVLMFSGGDDSLTCLKVAQELNIPIDYVIHGVTGTQVPETREFVHKVVKESGYDILEANAGTAYEDYVLRKGFPGVGLRAHSFIYHVLKASPFRKCISHNIRKRKRNRNVILLNGARRQESERRMKTMKNPIKKNGPNIWFNLINEFTDAECDKYLRDNNICKNPVSEKLCKSGECNCGTFSKRETDLPELKIWYPSLYNYIINLENKVKQKGFTWGWGESVPKEWYKKVDKEQEPQIERFRPMCTGCEDTYKDLEEQNNNEPQTSNY